MILYANDGGAFCYSCLAHRVDEHEPLPWRDEEDGQYRYCHGAGPDGVDPRWFGKASRALTWAETDAAAVFPKRRRRRKIVNGS